MTVRNRRRAVRLIAMALCSAGLLLLSSTSGATSAQAGQLAELGQGPAHWFGPDGYGNFGGGTTERAPAPRRLTAVDNLKNPGNGEIMPTTKTHLIFWLPAGFHYSSTLGDANYEAQMIKYFQDVGGSQILNTTTQYPGNNGTPDGTSTFIDSIVDTTAFPHAGADVAHAVTQGDINQEVFNQIGANAGWNKGMSEMYFVFLPEQPRRLQQRTHELQHECLLRVSHVRVLRLGHAGERLRLGRHPGQPERLLEGGRLRRLERHGRRVGRHDAQLGRARAHGGDHRPAVERVEDSTGGAGENGDKCNRLMGVANALHDREQLSGCRGRRPVQDPARVVERGVGVAPRATRPRAREWSRRFLREAT